MESLYERGARYRSAIYVALKICTSDLTCAPYSGNGTLSFLRRCNISRGLTFQYATLYYAKNSFYLALYVITYELQYLLYVTLHFFSYLNTNLNELKYIKGTDLKIWITDVC